MQKSVNATGICSDITMIHVFLVHFLPSYFTQLDAKSKDFIIISTVNHYICAGNKAQSVVFISRWHVI